MKGASVMAQGLRSHHYEWYVHQINNYYDDQKHCMVKDAIYRCMICSKIYHERYEYKPPPFGKSNKVLDRNKKRYSNQR